MSPASLSTTPGTKEPGPSNHPHVRIQDSNSVESTWHTTPFALHRVADKIELYATRTFCLHVPDCHETKEDIPRFAVEIMGEYPVALGGYSDIWQGILKSDRRLTRELVAVKVLRHFGGSARQPTFAKHLQREARIWSLLDHESVALFHGVFYHSDGSPAMISPWYSNGSADVYLRSHPRANPMKLIWEITLGVQYLHDYGIIHGDLKGANVMVDDTGHARLIDFGLSRLVDGFIGPSGLTLSTVSFSLRWTAPELVLADNAQATTATDVYALASTALQLLTGDVPYSSHRDVTILVTILNKLPQRRPTSPLRYSIKNVDSLWDLLEECWAEAPHRPSICAVMDRLLPFYP